jgi:hypothetical protein
MDGSYPMGAYSCKDMRVDGGLVVVAPIERRKFDSHRKWFPPFRLLYPLYLENCRKTSINSCTAIIQLSCWTRFIISKSNQLSSAKLLTLVSVSRIAGSIAMAPTVGTAYSTLSMDFACKLVGPLGDRLFPPALLVPRHISRL